MKRRWITAVVLSMAMVGFLVAGCAKQEPVKTSEEVKPPQENVQPAPAPAPEQPKEEVKPAPPAPAPGLADEIKMFEDQDIHFDFDKFDLKPEDEKILDEKYSFLNAHPDLKIRIEGNCDERGTVEYNLALGERRADAAKNYLKERGIAKDRIATVSYGKERPLDPGHNEEAWAKNRRDHVVIVNR